jgi:hypothetical protein
MTAAAEIPKPTPRPRTKGLASDFYDGPRGCKADASTRPDLEPFRCLRRKFMADKPIGGVENFIYNWHAKVRVFIL